METKNNKIYLIRMLIVGDTGVGKTSILIRFHENKFVEHQKTTIGVDYKAKHIEVNGEKIKLQIWDTAGQERFRSMTSAFYSKAQGVIATFDVSSAESFKSLPSWIKDIRREAPSDCQIVVCANKTDLPTERWRISRQEFTLFAKDNGLQLIESSASHGTGVLEAFTQLASQILENQRSLLPEMHDSEARESFALFDYPEKKKKSDDKQCCILS